jgi:hypothetical protein
MSNALNLNPGQKYRVKKEFTDYDGIKHSVGEQWIFVKTNFVPHADGLTLHVKETENSKETVYRFEWTDYSQGPLIRDFSSYVEAV